MKHVVLLFSLLLYTGTFAQECTNCKPVGVIDRLVESVKKLVDRTHGMTKVEDASMCIINPDANPLNGGWGHWWIETSADESYSWWAKSQLPKVDLEVVGKVLGGMEGEINGQTYYGGSPTEDPFHGNRPPELKLYDIYIPADLTVEDFRQGVRDFAKSYSGGWRWPGGQNCHTFIKEIIQKFGIELRRRDEQ